MINVYSQSQQTYYLVYFAHMCVPLSPFRNLQAAVGAFYDFYSNQSSSVLPLLTLLSDVTVGNGEPVAPNTRFSKTWRVKNSGELVWEMGGGWVCKHLGGVWVCV